MKIKIRIPKSFVKTILYFTIVFFTFAPISKVMAEVQLEDVVSFEVSDLNYQTNQITVTLVTKDDFKIFQKNLSFELLPDSSNPNTLGLAFPNTLSYTADRQKLLLLGPENPTNEQINIYENGTVFTLAPVSEITGTETLRITVQACSAGVCLLPGKLVLPVERGSISTFAVKEPTIVNPQAFSQNEALLADNNLKGSPIEKIVLTKESSLAETILKFLQTGSLFLFPLLFLAGLLTNLTPCVYPMIPITFGVMNQFGKNQKSKLKLSLIYVLGMVIIYALLGVIAAMTGQVFGSQLASPLLNTFVAVLMILLGFAMLDFFDLSFLQRLSYKIPFAEKSPALAVGTMGAVSGLVAAPCTGPILSMILVLIAQTHNPFTGFLYMLCFALGFGAPYVVLGFVSQNITKLPKMHRLGEVIKLFFACLMFGLAMYFLKGMLSKTSFFNFFYIKPDISDVIAIVVLLFLFAGIERPKFRFFSKLARVGVVASLSLLCLWLTLWLSNAFVVSYTQESSHAFEEVLKSSQIQWKTNLDEASDEARKNNKKILVDVWAEWCTACLEMEATTWKDPNIIRIIDDKFVPVKLNYTKPTNELSKQLSEWLIVGLPAILVLDPTNNTLLEVNQGIVSTNELLEKLSVY